MNSLVDKRCEVTSYQGLYIGLVVAVDAVVVDGVAEWTLLVRNEDLKLRAVKAEQVRMVL